MSTIILKYKVLETNVELPDLGFKIYINTCVSIETCKGSLNRSKCGGHKNIKYSFFFFF